MHQLDVLFSSKKSMSKIITRLLVALAFIIGMTPINGQKSFKELYKEANLISSDSIYNQEASIERYQAFLAAAQQKQDSLQQIFAYLRLSNEFLQRQAYPEAIALLLDAEQLANHAKNNLWKGYINHWRGTVYTFLEDYEAAIKYFNLSLAVNYEKRDSEIVAFNLEQLGAVFSYQEEYELAHEYYEKAFPLLEKYSTKRDLAIALANYGSLLHYEKQSQAAIEVYKKAIKIYEEIGDKRKEFRTRGSLADEYYTIGDTEQALELFQICEQENLKNNWRMNLLGTYEGLSSIHKTLGDKEKALFYYEKYTLLNDTIRGVKVEREINKLEIENELKQKDLVHQKEQLNLIKKNQQTLSKWQLFTIISLVFALVILLFFVRKRRKAHKKLEQHEESIIQLTQSLLEKGRQLKSLEARDKSNGKITQQHALDFDKNVFSQSILTDNEWTSFKVRFEKLIPGYIQRLRTTHPELSDAEERLFLLLKLKLKRKEIATILGISPESVKKTRTRLRKRFCMNTPKIKTYIYFSL